MYFGYGSNINLTSLKAKGVEPTSSVRAILPGWKLIFNVEHWFRHEGGVGNITPSDLQGDHVEGIIHCCPIEHLAALDAVEAYGVGYDRIEVEVQTANGPVKALTYVGLPGYLNDLCLPTQRYLNIILKGAEAAGLSETYIEKLRRHPIHQPDQYPPFEHPLKDAPIFSKQTLTWHPLYTGVGGAVFDMKGASPRLECLHSLFGGKDTTLFHLKRLDSSDGHETIEDIIHDRLSPEGRAYINAYLHEYNREFTYVGRYRFEDSLK